MIRFRLLIFLLIICLSSSCNKILFYLAGVRNPQEESKEDLKKYITRAKLDTNDIYIPKDTSAFYKLNKISSSQSGYLFFNSQLQMLSYKDTGSACSAPVIVFAKNLCLSERPLFYKKYDLSLITSQVKGICNSQAGHDEYDTYAVIFWYKYFGKMKFQSDVIDIVKSLKENNCKTKIYLVNLDLQPGWKKDIPIKIN